mmetsp:Transcript_124098/g.345446  ORF Transcript_124098/g.345446 Transcript_124098/m.345446 type:complete len:260 (-) Transcript_124098:456-1235(-)
MEGRGCALSHRRPLILTRLKPMEGRGCALSRACTIALRATHIERGCEATPVRCGMWLVPTQQQRALHLGGFRSSCPLSTQPRQGDLLPSDKKLYEPAVHDQCKIYARPIIRLPSRDKSPLGLIVIGVVGSCACWEISPACLRSASLATSLGGHISASAAPRDFGSAHRSSFSQALPPDPRSRWHSSIRRAARRREERTNSSISGRLLLLSSSSIQMPNTLLNSLASCFNASISSAVKRPPKMLGISVSPWRTRRLIWGS